MHLNSVTFRPDKYPVQDRYPFNLPTFRETSRIAFTTPVTLWLYRDFMADRHKFLGENGSR